MKSIVIDLVPKHIPKHYNNHDFSYSYIPPLMQSVNYDRDN